MLHCGGNRLAVLVLILLATGGLGCAQKAVKPDGGAAKAVTPKPEEKKPESRPLVGTLLGGEVTLFDAQGVTVAQVKVPRGALGRKSSEGGTTSVLNQSGGTHKSKPMATLYEKGKPMATIMADEVTADEKTHIVTGKGNVVARSLTEQGSPTVRADTMTWRPDTNEIRGSGNVLITRDNSLHLPGKAFVADTRIRRIRMTAGSRPGTLKF